MGMVCIHLKGSVERSLNYYLLPKLYVKLWLCPSVILIYMHSFPQSRLLYLSPRKNACCPGCAPDHHENGRCVSRSSISNFFLLFFLIASHAIRRVTATFKATKSWFRSEILWSSSNSSHGLKKLSQLNGVEVLLPHSLWFLKAINDTCLLWSIYANITFFGLFPSPAAFLINNTCKQELNYM